MDSNDENNHLATNVGGVHESSPDSFLPPIIKSNIGPLIHAIARQKMVLYVGAGASIPAGLPSWEQFLKRCLERAVNEPGVDKRQWDFTDELLNQNHDYLAAAELLQLGLGNQLERYIWDEFGNATVPSPVHHALARIPASIVITVNYDRLLESVYVERPNVWTWRDPDAFFSAIRNSRFAIIKTHGDVGNAPSLVLTRTQYRDLIHQNEAFNACFRTLLSHRTFLFVGTSLRDPDLMQQMDIAKLSLGLEFGPHYAILFDNEVDQYFERHLRTSYNIHVIRCEKADHLNVPRATVGEQRKDSSSQSVKWCPERRCRAVVRVLTEIGGLASRQLAEHLPSPPLDEATFSRLAACQQLIERAVELTGAFRGDLCLIDSDEQFRSMRTIAEAPKSRQKGVCGAEEANSNRSNKSREDLVPHNSVIGGLFLRQKVHADYIHLSDVHNSAILLQQQGFDGIEYVSCHPDVQSELAVPVYCDGQRVGVLNLESEIPHAFTRDHLKVARRVATSAGWIYYEARQRQEAGRVLGEYFRSPQTFKSLMDKSRLLKHFSMEYILWNIDYDMGIVRAHPTKLSQKGRDRDFRYHFDKRSLATLVLKSRHDKIVNDAQEDQAKGEAERILAHEGVEEFNIQGPISGTPVQRNGTTCAVLVVWSDRYSQADESERLTIRKNFALYHERVKRLSQLLANNPGLPGEWSKLNAAQFIENVDATLKKFDDGHDEWWFDRDSNLTAEKQMAIAQELLKVIVDPCAGLQRARLWLRYKSDGQDEFRFVLRQSLPEAMSWDQHGAQPGQVKGGIVGNACDPYVQYTKARYKNDPYARHQHRSMFDRPDNNSEALHKDPDGMWIVGPVVLGRSKPRALMGYVSADNHRPLPLSGEVKCGDNEHVVKNQAWQDCVMRDRSEVPREVQAFQRSVIDIITDLLAWVIDKRFPVLKAEQQLRTRPPRRRQA